MLSKSVTFLDFRISRNSVAEAEVFTYIHRDFSHESVGERIFKIGPHLPKLLSNVKGYTFLGHSVYKNVGLIMR